MESISRKRNDRVNSLVLESELGWTGSLSQYCVHGEDSASNSQNDSVLFCVQDGPLSSS